MKKIISRSEAGDLGAHLFFTGKPCRSGHIAERYVSNGSCTTCVIDRAKRRHAADPSLSAEQKRRRKADNPGRISAQKAAQYQANKAKIATYLEVNREKIAERKAAYHASHREKVSATGAKWRRANRPRIAKRNRERYAADPDAKVYDHLRVLVKRMARAVKHGRPTRAFDVCGCSPNQFRSHIESLFRPGMSWANHGDWHIDHKIPIFVMVASGVTDPALVNQLSNLQPLWAIENLQKGVKVQLA